MRRKMLAKSSPFLVLAVLGLLLTLASSGWAGPMRCGMMGGMAQTPEQAAQAFDLRQKFFNETAGVRKEMAMKRAELATLWRAENPDEKQILAKQKELSALRDQMQQKAVSMRLEMKKINPNCPMGMGGMGGGHGMMGMGPGGGMGPGCNW